MPRQRKSQAGVRFTWKGLVYYGETVGFALAWGVVFLVASSLSTRVDAPQAADQIASAQAAPAAIEISR